MDSGRPIKLDEILSALNITNGHISFIKNLPQPRDLIEHQDSDGSIRQCCQIATIQLKGMAKAADTSSGDILNNIQKITKIGQKSAVFLCEAYEWRMQLDTSSMSAIIRLLLSHSQDVVSGTLKPIAVSFLSASPPDQLFIGTSSDKNHRWFNYQECVGILSPTGGLAIWNHGKWLTSSDGQLISMQPGILAWRLQIDQDVILDGIHVPAALTNQWFATQPIQPPKIMNGVFDSNRKVPIVIISGAGPVTNVATSLRHVFPKSALKIVSMPSSVNAFNENDGVYDGSLIIPNSINILQHFKMHSSSLYLPTGASEIQLLVDIMAQDVHNDTLSKRILIPSKSALQAIKFPAIPAAAKMPYFRVAPFIEMASHESPTEFQARAEAFLHAHSFPYLIGSADQDTVQVNNMVDAKKLTKKLLKQGEQVSIQQILKGFKESILFSCFDGELLGVVHLRGDHASSYIPPDLAGQLVSAVAKYNWTGLNQIEVIRTLDNRCYVTKWHPQLAFDTGITEVSNLVANLVVEAFEKLLGIHLYGKKLAPKTAKKWFNEQPLQKPTSKEVNPLDFATTSNGIPNGIMAKKCPGDMQLPTTALPSVAGILKDNPSTPYRHLDMPNVNKAMTTFKQLAEAAALNCTQGHIQPIVALSVKTQPEKRILQEALNCGYLAEAISQGEVDTALHSGFSNHQVILNGPAKFWRRQKNGVETNGIGGSYFAVFADSTSEFEQICQMIHKGKLTTTVLGIRLGMPGTGTRFGVDFQNPELLKHMLEALKEMPKNVQLGFHVHFTATDIGMHGWFKLRHAFVSACKSIIEAIGYKSNVILDFGGGLLPITNQMQPHFEKELRELLTAVYNELPQVRHVIFEPGKAVLQGSTTMITRILAVNEPVMAQNDLKGEQEKVNLPGRKIVVDTAMTDMPIMFHENPHPIYVLCASCGSVPQWQLVEQRGNDFVVGRILAEIDILASGVRLPEDLAVGDYIAVTNVGAYDTSWSFPFGEGYHH